MRVKIMYYQSGIFIFFSALRGFFSTGMIFEASPFHFSVLQTHFSQLVCSHQYPFPMFPEVCGLTLKKIQQTQKPTEQTIGESTHIMKGIILKSGY